MPIADLYSSRQAAQDKTDDVWEYERVPAALRVQVSNIVEGALGTIYVAAYALNLAASKIRFLVDAFNASK